MPLRLHDRHVELICALLSAVVGVWRFGVVGAVSVVNRGEIGMLNGSKICVTSNVVTIPWVELKVIIELSKEFNIVIRVEPPL